jgi:hypothetical protein
MIAAREEPQSCQDPSPSALHVNIASVFVPHNLYSVDDNERSPSHHVLNTTTAASYMPVASTDKSIKSELRKARPWADLALNS